MKCAIPGCPGYYEPRLIFQTVKRSSEFLIFENVPAEVCDVCSDTLFAPETVRHLEDLMRNHGRPQKQASVYEYA